MSSSSSSPATTPTTPTTPAPKPAVWLATVQQQFMEGRNCDVVVRVSIAEPAPKRTAVEDGTAKRNRASRRQQEHTVDIPCHSLILTLRSRYFKAVLSGTCVESQQKIVEIVLADKQAVDDFKLLLKLSCALSYVQDGDARLSKTMRIRLAILGNAFKFVDCVQECLQSLSEEVSAVENAVSLLDAEELWGHEAAMAVRSKVIKGLKEEADGLSAQVEEGETTPEAVAAVAVLMSKVITALVRIIDKLGPRKMHGETAQEKKRQALQQAGKALGKALRPVDGLFGEGTTRTGLACLEKGAFYQLLPLLKALLGSDGLQLRSKNDAYYLLCAWFTQSTSIFHASSIPWSSSPSSSSSSSSLEDDEDGRRALFQELLPQLRFHHMSHDFLSAVVSACPYARASGLIAYIMHCSHAMRTAPRALAIKEGFNKNRIEGPLKCIFKTKFDLADLLAVQKPPAEPTRVYKHIGLASGFPVAVYVCREADGTVGSDAYVAVPFCKDLDVEGCDKRRLAGFQFTLKIGEVEKTGENVFDGVVSWGWWGFLGKWEEVVRPESPCFPNGVLAVELTMRPMPRY